MFAPSFQFVKVYPTAGTALTVTEVPEVNEPAPVVVPPSKGFEDNATVYSIGFAVKLATKALFALIGKVKSESVETIVVPSVQFAKVYPVAGTALTVTEVPELKEPAPEVVPPIVGLDESATVYLIVAKLATKVRFSMILKVVSVFKVNTFPPSVQFVKVYPVAATALIDAGASVKYKPSTVVVPPNSGLDDKTTVCCPIVVKLQT